MLKRPTLYRYKQFPWVIVFLYFLNIHRWFNITNINSHCPNDDSFELKRYGVDFVSQ